uniref:Uncharacterized protein n=1 Tax=Anopheles melas TaxID=34690 RepID=A0A182TF65_9DIPT
MDEMVLSVSDAIRRTITRRRGRGGVVLVLLLLLLLIVAQQVVAIALLRFAQIVLGQIGQHVRQFGRRMEGGPPLLGIAQHAVGGGASFNLGQMLFRNVTFERQGGEQLIESQLPMATNRTVGGGGGVRVPITQSLTIGGRRWWWWLLIDTTLRRGGQLHRFLLAFTVAAILVTLVSVRRWWMMMMFMVRRID